MGDEKDAWGATTYGTGELIAAAAQAGAAVILVAVGGSATTDGGAGAIEAIEAAGGIGKAKIVILTDVRTVWEDAPKVFGPQKGADAAMIARLEQRLDELAQTLPKDPRGVPMTGAAGGLSGGLWAKYGAALEPGAPFVLDALDFDDRMRASRAVVTGEGKLDQQTLQGKLVGEIGTRTRQAGVPLHAIVGTRRPRRLRQADDRPADGPGGHEPRGAGGGRRAPRRGARQRRGLSGRGGVGRRRRAAARAGRAMRAGRRGRAAGGVQGGRPRGAGGRRGGRPARGAAGVRATGWWSRA